jgi:hypothetical protein
MKSAKSLSTFLIPVLLFVFTGCPDPTSVQEAVSQNANLGNIVISAGSLSPAFAAGTTSYVVNVPNTVSAIAVAGTPADYQARVAYFLNGGPASSPVPLAVGSNTVTLRVSAPAGNTKDYTLTVNRAPPANVNANLADLTVDNGDLNPAFSPETESYTVTVVNSVNAVTVTGTPAEPGAGVAYLKGGESVSNPIPLEVGDNVITVRVSAPEGDTKDYILTVNRAAQSDSNADLAGLTVSDGSLSPAFSPAITGYTVNVVNSVSAVTVTGTPADSGAAVAYLKGGTSVSNPIPLAVGSNAITVRVTSAEGNSKDYTLTVIRAAASTNAYLGDLTVSEGSLSPAFAAGTTGYTVNVGNSVSSITVTGTAADSGASVAYLKGGTSVSNPIALTTGSNTITVRVTAESGYTRNYNLTINRAAASTNANLAGLTVSAGSLSPAFAAGTTGYTVNVAYSVSAVTVTGTAADSLASIGYLKGDTPVSNPITLSAGANIITVRVTAEAGDTKNYFVVVNREPTSVQWARSVTAGSSYSIFYSVAVDGSGNVYAAGHQAGTGAYTYGPGVSVSGTYSGYEGANVVLVKYDSSGTAQWARSATAGSSYSRFDSVAVDGSGNVYAAGYQNGTGVFTYGPGVSVAGTSSNGNAVLVKYDSSGAAQWARSVTAGSGDSIFRSVAVDGSGNVYAAGYQNGIGTDAHTYGPGVSVFGASYSSNDVVLVKYDSSGTAQWARSTTAGSSYSRFDSVAVDGSGNVYAAGSQDGTGAYTYGPGVSVAGTYSGYNENVVLVKYNSSGTALWARSVTAGSARSEFDSVAVDGSGNVYAAGHQAGTGAYTYGPGVSVSGTYSGYNGNVVLVKYDSSGNAQWARSVTAGSSSFFYSVAVDGSGNVYAAGAQNGPGAYTYGPGVSAAPTIYSAGSVSTSNVVLVKYDSFGTALWAKTVSARSDGSAFSSVAVDGSDNIYAAGSQLRTGALTYGTGVSVSGTASANNAVLVKYRE